MEGRGMEDALFLSCEDCGYRCSLHGPAAHAIADHPPDCPGCGLTMTVEAPPRRHPLEQAS